MVTDLTDPQLVDLVDLYRSTWWAGDRTVDDAQAVVAGSALVVGLTEGGSDRLVGFCRALTDRRALAVILGRHRPPGSRGLGLRPELAGVGSIELVCQPELLDFYRRFGFTDQVGSSRLMCRSVDPRLSGQVPPA